MTDEQLDHLNEQDSRLMDSLLQQALRPDDAHSKQQVGKLLEAIRKDAVTHHQQPEAVSRRRLSWFPVSIAAAVLVAVVLVIQPGGSQNTALAAVERSIIAEQLPQAREYEVTIVPRNSSGRRRPGKHTLFVRQRDFAIRVAPVLGSGEIWLGGQGDERWIVPRFGPVQVGTEELFGRPLPDRNIMETPFMKVETILDRMKRFYDLELISGESLTQGTSTFLCDHIVGTRARNTRVAIPQRVELWADAKSGFARRIELGWGDQDADSRLLEATAELVGTPELPAEFFHHMAHHEADRKVNRTTE